MSTETAPLEAHQIRVLDELKELRNRTVRLAAFLESPQNAIVPAAERLVMYEQHQHMQRYESALCRRIELWGITDEATRYLSR